MVALVDRMYELVDPDVEPLVLVGGSQGMWAVALRLR